MIGRNFIGDDQVTLILGDNLFEDNFSVPIASFTSGARVFVKEVNDPQRYGVAEFGSDSKVISIEEKPAQPKSNYAVTGLYIYDNSVIAKAKSLQPSPRGEIEITDLNNVYLKEGALDVAMVNGRWLDTGTFESLHEAIEFARARELAKVK